MAKLGTSLRGLGLFFEVKFWGFNDKLGVLARTVLQGVQEFKTDPLRFKVQSPASWQLTVDSFLFAFPPEI